MIFNLGQNQSKPRKIVIGDVHGHYELLMRLLEAIAPNQSDRLYFVGDLIDRGPHSNRVVDFVMRNQHACLLGNHEQMLLEAVKTGGVHQAMWFQAGGETTLRSYDNRIPQEHIDWLAQLPLFFDLEEAFIVHAGIHPQIPLNEQTAAEFCWIRGDFHATTVPYFPHKPIIIGHTITFTFPGVQPGKLAAGAGWIDIDTGAYHPTSGWLTALDLTNKRVYQTNRQSQRTRNLALKRAINRVNPEQLLSRDRDRDQRRERIVF